MSDIVNQPPHYISDNGIETIDVIEAFTKDLGPFEAYCTGNIIKYVCRWKHKNGLEDLKKARWYINKLLSEENLSEIEEMVRRYHDPNNQWENYPGEDGIAYKDDVMFLDLGVITGHGNNVDILHDLPDGSQVRIIVA